MSVQQPAKAGSASTGDGHRTAIGRSRGELTTPALILDLEVLRRNIAVMAEWTKTHPRIRPHTKVHKCAEIARLQIEAGAIGLTTATVWEALAMANAGFDDILIANEVGGEEKLSLLAAAARETKFIVAVDHPEGAKTLSDAMQRAGSQIGVLVEIDIGLRRGGVRSDEDALLVAQTVSALPGLILRGAMGYEGWVVMEPDRQVRARKAAEAIGRLVARVERLEMAGFPIEIVSAGGTNTHDMTGAHPRVTELQAGSYALMDAAYAPLSPSFQPALTVLGTVISRRETTAVLDCGTKVIAVDLALPQPLDSTMQVREVHEEHTLLNVAADHALRYGDRVELTIGYCGGTVNLHDVYHVIEQDRVVDIWPILARGDGRGPTTRGART
jgi:D-serine deaminase-like pyridoxal phosphate-dependent protein